MDEKLTVEQIDAKLRVLSRRARSPKERQLTDSLLDLRLATELEALFVKPPAYPLGRRGISWQGG